MSMHYNVYIISVHYPQVSLCINGLGSSEQNIGELRSCHGTAPSVGQTGPQGLTDQSRRLRRTSHMSHMKRAGNLSVDSSGRDLLFLPQILSVLRRSLQEVLISKYFSVLAHAQESHLVGQIIDVFALSLHAPLFCDPDQLLGIFYLVGAFRLRAVQRMTDFTAVVGVGGSSAGSKFQIVTGNNTVGITSADTPGCFRGNAAGSHRTDTAADTLLAKFAVGRLVCHTILPCVSSHLLSSLKQTVSRRFELLNRCQFKISHYLPP